jgi:putative tricarboxylic transport membrane protein
MDILSWPAFGYMLMAVPIGLMFGTVPGMGGKMGLALMIPFTFGMTPVCGFALLLGLHAVVHTAGSVPAILFDTPGTGPNAATCLDGYPMAQRGEAGKALGAALMSSMIGGIIGAVCMICIIPVVRPLVLSFGPPEFFMLACLGLTFIALMSGDDLLKGLVSGGMGLIIAFVGMDPQTGTVRFAFDQLYLYDGIQLVTVVIGTFALASITDMAVSGGSIAKGGPPPSAMVKGGGVYEGMKVALKNWNLIIRCSAIGYIIGMIPGLGGDTAAFITYGHAVQTAKDKSQFGKGDVRGVIAPDAAHNSKEAGTLIPTLAFGIPGSSGMAILFGAFLILGVAPGVDMLTKHLSLVYSMAWTLVFANILAIAILLPFAVKLAKITFIRTDIIVPFILVFGTVGSFLTTSHMGNIIITLATGLLGYGMKVFKYPRAPLLLGIVLGKISEGNLMLSLDLYGPTFFLRPICLVLLLCTIGTIFYPIYAKKRAAAKGEVMPKHTT